MQTGAGSDSLDGGTGLNTLFGGAGIDTFTLRQNAYNFVGDFELGIDKLDLEGIAFSNLSFFQGTNQPENMFIFVEQEAIAQIANTQVQDIDNSNNFV